MAKVDRMNFQHSRMAISGTKAKRFRNVIQSNKKKKLMSNTTGETRSPIKRKLPEAIRINIAGHAR